MNDIPPSQVDAPIQSPEPINDLERVLARALDIVARHTQQHGELWKEADAIELGAMVRHKANRANYAARRYQDGHGREEAKARIIESSLDGINYFAFLICAVERDG